MTKEGFFKNAYVYDEYFDCIICPNNQVLNYSITNKEGYPAFKRNSKICKNCVYLPQCTESKTHQKIVTLHVWHEYMEMREDVRRSQKGNEIYSIVG